MPRLKGTITMSITVTFLIYHFLLSGGYENRADIIRSTILHYIVPIMTIADYILFDKKGIYKIPISVTPRLDRSISLFNNSVTSNINIIAVIKMSNWMNKIEFEKNKRITPK